MLCRHILRNKLFVLPSYKRFNTTNIIATNNLIPKCECINECKFQTLSNEIDDFAEKGFMFNMSIGAVSSLSGAIYGLEGFLDGAFFGGLIIFLNSICILAPIIIYKQYKVVKYESICRRY